MGTAMSNKEPWQERWEPVGEETRTGGQGETFRVNSRDGGRLGILKKLRNQRSDQARARMSQEVLNLRILHGAGCKVPEVLDRNTDQFEDKSVRLYFIMEYIDGPTLAETVENRGGPRSGSLNWDCP
jgi:predicted Ser/Thr protein kinase